MNYWKREGAGAGGEGGKRVFAANSDLFGLIRAVISPSTAQNTFPPFSLGCGRWIKAEEVGVSWARTVRIRRMPFFLLFSSPLYTVSMICARSFMFEFLIGEWLTSQGHSAALSLPFVAQTSLILFGERVQHPRGSSQGARNLSTDVHWFIIFFCGGPFIECRARTRVRLWNTVLFPSLLPGLDQDSWNFLLSDVGETLCVAWRRRGFAVP